MNNVSNLLELMNCEDSLYKFVQTAWPAIEGTTPFIANWHIEAICEHLEAATRGEIKNLIISVPPRTSKTTIISIMWPAWVWIKNAKVKFLFASYAQKISWEHSRLCKMLIESQWYQDRWSHVVQLSKDQVTKGHFTNTAMGHRIATSVGAGGTALGGDILVCLPFDVLITTDSGGMFIGDIVNKKLDVKVQSYNHSSSCVELKSIEKYEKRFSEETYEIGFDDGSFLECTGNHPIFVEGNYDVGAYPPDSLINIKSLGRDDRAYYYSGYVKAEEIKEGDVVLALEERNYIKRKTVKSIIAERLYATVYNIRVSDNHNYFANGILVHNCDDPNDAGESEVVSNSTNDWVSRVWPSRLNPGGLGVNVLVQQRTRQMDVSGHKMKIDQDNKIVKLILPMELEKATRARTIILPSTKGKIWEDPRTKEGELLCPQYLDEAAIRQRKLELGSYNYATQYQQRPAPPEGGLIKRDWFLIWEKENFPKFNYIVQSWDCAMIGENTKGQKKVAMSNISYSACTTWGLFEHNKISHLMLISAWRGKVDYPELLNRARRLQQNFLDIEEDTELKPDYNLRPDRVLIESKALGYSLDKDLSSKGLISTGFNPGEFGDKDRRVHLSTPYMECGRIWVKKDVENKRLYSDHQTLIDSAVMFPNAEGRDLVDTMTQVILYLSKKERRLVHVMNRSFENDFSEDIKQTKAKDR